MNTILKPMHLQSLAFVENYIAILQSMAKDGDLSTFAFHGGFETINEAYTFEESVLSFKEIATDLQFHVEDS